ncbi:hypothetical protein [Bradyrhizobium sp. USDA 3650]
MNAYRQVRGEVDIAFDDLGLQVLKNIAELMRVWRFAGQNAAKEGPAAVGTQALTLPDKPSMAALPFQNMSAWRVIFWPRTDKEYE